jgi:hypothetical protein
MLCISMSTGTPIALRHDDDAGTLSLRNGILQHAFVRAPFCSKSRGRRGDDRSSFLAQKRPCASPTDPKLAKISVTKSAKQASQGSKTLSKRSFLTHFDSIQADSACFEFFGQNARVLKRFFIQICARRTRLARARDVVPFVEPDAWMDLAIWQSGDFAIEGRGKNRKASVPRLSRACGESWDKSGQLLILTPRISAGSLGRCLVSPALSCLDCRIM